GTNRANELLFLGLISMTHFSHRLMAIFRFRAALWSGLLLCLTLGASAGASPATDVPDRPRRGGGAPDAAAAAKGLFSRDNLVAWCIVPFDRKKRAPEDRAAMLERLGFRHFAYDWRAEHIPTFDAEIAALRRHGIAL